jgi:hypothetical protein
VTCDDILWLCSWFPNGHRIEDLGLGKEYKMDGRELLILVLNGQDLNCYCERFHKYLGRCSYS